MSKWEKNIHEISEMAGKYPHDSYAALFCVIQLEWIFLQSMTKYMGRMFTGLENILRETFLPHLFFVKSKSLPHILGTLSTMLVNKSGLGLQDSVTSANDK